MVELKASHRKCCYTSNLTESQPFNDRPQLGLVLSVFLFFNFFFINIGYLLLGDLPLSPPARQVGFGHILIQTQEDRKDIIHTLPHPQL